MAGVKALAVLAVLAASIAPTHAAPTDPWASFIAEAAHRFTIPDAWIRSVMQAESAGQTTLHGQPITSRAGAMGLMQVMPGTYQAMRVAYHLGGDAYDPHDNILAGAAYLRAMFDRFGYPGLFAAYNAGPGSYDAYLMHERALPAETVRYLATVSGRNPGSNRSPRDSVFATLTGASSIATDTVSDGLFVPLHSPIGH
jgi:soluble lytic murein transglycosylase-like protein